jgi:hypothetical protein
MLYLAALPAHTFVDFLPTNFCTLLSTSACAKPRHNPHSASPLGAFVLIFSQAWHNSNPQVWQQKKPKLRLRLYVSICSLHATHISILACLCAAYRCCCRAPDNFGRRATNYSPYSPNELGLVPLKVTLCAHTINSKLFSCGHTLSRLLLIIKFIQ